MKTTPQQRLAWLEEALPLAALGLKFHISLVREKLEKRHAVEKS